MLGSNLGKKVTAGIVQEKYKQFLKNKPEEKQKQLTPEERKQAKRAEMRKKGIFVKADDPDETPTIMEKIDGPSHPMIYILPEKPTIWKKKKSGGKKTKSKKREKKPEKSQKSDVSISSGPQKKKAKKDKKPAIANSLPSSSSSTNTEQSSRGSKRKKSAEKPRKSAESDGEPKKSAKSQKSSKETIQEKKKEMEKPEEKIPEKVQEADQKSEKENLGEKKGEEIKKIPSETEQTDPLKSLPTALPILPIPEQKAELLPSKTDSEVKIGSENGGLTSASSNPSLVDSQKKILSAPIAESQPNAFEKLDDDEFEKMTSDADEKEMLKLAPRLLKVAKKHAAIEKCLTPEENEVLAKFFSGKQKLDATVLAVLDSALDKIIDYLQKNNCAVDEETKAVMKKRDKLKAAMMKEFLVSPQYLPKTWTAKFNAWKNEAEKQKNGINWFRVFFHYPRHKSFDDGPEDTFGNFRRRHRGLLMSFLLGPGDVKSFEETKREEDCQGMFLDTKIIENANTENKDTSSTVSTDRNSVNTAKSLKRK